MGRGERIGFTVVGAKNAECRENASQPSVVLMCADWRQCFGRVYYSSEGRVGFRLLTKVWWDCDVENWCSEVEGRCLGRFSFLASLANFADFGDNRVFGFRGRVGESVPQNGVGVKVSIGVQHFTVAKRSLVEGPPDKVGTGAGTGPVPCGLSCRDHGGGSRYRGGGLES